MFLGALAQSIPDLDFIAAFWKDTASNLLAHRGFTHSILFAIMATFFFWIAGRALSQATQNWLFNLASIFWPANMYSSFA